MFAFISPRLLSFSHVCFRFTHVAFDRYQALWPTKPGRVSWINVLEFAGPLSDSDLVVLPMLVLNRIDFGLVIIGNTDLVRSFITTHVGYDVVFL
jgi:hypothetical protein